MPNILILFVVAIKNCIFALNISHYYGYKIRHILRQFHKRGRQRGADNEAESGIFERTLS